MILILLSWVYIFFTALSFGVAFSKVLRMQQFELVITTILGLFSITLFATVWAFFGPINILFHIVLLSMTALFWFRQKAIFTFIFQNAVSQIRTFSFPIKILLAVSSFLALAQSATLPFIIDNESYYIQTIKWLNEYGFVKGVANLHLFLGQTSGWHITQSVYSFSFLYDRFNDLNGFCLLLGNFFAFQKLHAYFTKGHSLDLVFGLLPLTYVFLFQFISSPSPDLPIYVFGFILFSVFLQEVTGTTKDAFIILSILTLFAVYIKITAVILVIFPFVFFIKQYKVLKDSVFGVSCIGTLVLLLFVLKNAVLTGYPLFPLPYFRIAEFDYTIPRSVMDFFFSKNMMHSFYIPYSAFEGLSILDLAKHYFLYNGISGYIGIVSLIMLFVVPILIIKKRLSKSIWTIYFAFILVVILLCFSSPQYRFYVYFTLFFLLLLLSQWITNKKWILGFLSVNLVILAILILVPISFSSLTKNNLLSQNNTFHGKNIIIPEPNTKWKQEFKKGSIGNMSYHSPLDVSFFWVTGNGNLPCVNTEQLNYFQHGFFYIPQQRSTDLNDGFYAQKVSGHE